MTTLDAPPSRLLNALEWLGASVLALIGLIVPLTIVPPKWFPAFLPDRAPIVEAKLIVLQALCCVAIVLGALAFISDLSRRLRNSALLPAIVLLAYVVWGGVSVALAPSPHYSLTYWLPHALAIGAALTGPLFLRDPRKARVVLLAIVAAGAVVAVIGLVSAFGWRGFNRFVYGADPRDLLDDPNRRTIIQGGGVRAGSMSTLGNPEYTGGYVAAMAAILAIVFFDWAPRAARRFLPALRLLCVGGLVLMLLHLAATGTRQPWVALTLAALLRLSLELRLPRRVLAAGFCAQLFVVLLLGIKPALLTGGLLLAAAVVYTLRNGRLAALLRGADRINLTLVFGAPVLIALLIAAFSIPGPWNPFGMRIAQRFLSATSGNEISFSERSLMFAVASQLSREHPLFGAGPGYFFSQFYPTMAKLVKEDETGALYIMRDRLGGSVAEQSHNDYLQIAAEQGIVALALLLTALLLVMAGLCRIIDREAGPRRALALANIACLVTFLGIMFTSFPLQMPARSAVFWMIIAGSLGLLAGEREAPP